MSVFGAFNSWLTGGRGTTFEVFKGKDGWRWHERASNGRIKSTSEAYASKPNAVRAARRKAGETVNARVVVVV